MIWKRKGTLTVEAAFIGVFSVVAAGIVISFCLYVYQRCWYTQAACEIAMTGSGQGIFENHNALEIANEKWNVMQSECYPQPDSISADVTESRNGICITVSGSTPIWGRSGMNLSVKVSQKKIKPVSYIRKMAALMQKE